MTEYQWDYRNRLVGVVTKDVSGNVLATVEYQYDVYDRRIAKSVDSDGDGNLDLEERYVLDSDEIALVFDGEGNLKERFLHGVTVDQVIAQENADGSVYWALADNLGSVRYVLDHNGDVINSITYDAFGEVTSETDPSIDFRNGYTGRELDEETGQHYYRSRYYDSSVGRFISEDTIGFAGGDANLYRYVGNNATNAIDPFGEAAIFGTIIIKDVILPAGFALYSIYQIEKQKQKLNRDRERNNIKSLPDNHFPNPEGIPDREENKFSDNTGHTTKPDIDTNPPSSPTESNVEPITHTGNSCPANDDFSNPYFDSSVKPPWRGTAKILDGNLKKGWIHIDARHVTGDHPTKATSRSFRTWNDKRSITRRSK